MIVEYFVGTDDCSLYNEYLRNQLFCYGLHNLSADSALGYIRLQSDDVGLMLAYVF